ncbi:MAG: class I SAM-dependent methyltransferase [Prolixibacteraceae bacterium]|jgi:tRNA (cmo5U34)-methyltransferase|nr:class I SAM-dependent methyltransferase [Prolixibacteraceae bacterium]
MGNSFDDKAASWDDKASRIDLVNNVWKIIAKESSFKPSYKVLDYGCGTGLLGYKMITDVKDVTFCDTSEGMLAQVLKKRDFFGYENVKTLLADLTKDETPVEEFNIIVSMLVLHHVKDLDKLLSTFHQLLGEEGLFCWVDIDEEDGSFHDDNTGIHHFGFSKQEVEKYLNEHGFDLKFYTNELFYEKEREDKKIKYPLFIAIGEKK